METCRFYSQASQTVQCLECGAAGRKMKCCCEWVCVCVSWIYCSAENSVCWRKGTYLTIWTVVLRPFWRICPGRRGLSGDGPMSQRGYLLAHSSHSPLKCWRPAGERQAAWDRQGAGPPPWVLPLLSPSGSGHLCCSLQRMIEQKDNHRLDSDEGDSTNIQYQGRDLVLCTE